MKKQESYRSEAILGGMMMLQMLSMLFPNMLPSGIAEISLGIGLFAYVVCKLEAWDHALKRKYN